MRLASMITTVKRASRVAVGELVSGRANTDRAAG